jgi:hypothetical protein
VRVVARNEIGTAVDAGAWECRITTRESGHRVLQISQAAILAPPTFKALI